MGLFSSKYKTYVGTSNSRLVEDAFLPNSVLSGTVKAVMRDGDVGSYVLEDLVHSLGSKARTMYSLGQRDYTFGTPSASILTNTRGAAEVEQVLEALEGGNITLDYLHTGTPNILHLAWLKLARDYGYDSLTNKIGSLTTSIGRDVFLHDMVVVLPQATAANYTTVAREQWGIPAQMGDSPTRAAQAAVPTLSGLAAFTSVEHSATATEDGVRVEYAWTTAAGALQQGSLFLGNSEIDDKFDYYQAAYYVVSTGTKKWWLYQVGQGTYPDLDALMMLPAVTLGTFLPFIHFRHQKQSVGANMSSVEYRDSLKMSKKLGIDYAQILAAVNENPDVADVEQAYLAVMTPANTENEVERRYLFDFFDQLYDTGSMNVVPEVNLTRFGNRVSMSKRAVAVIQDKWVKSVLSCSGIVKRLIAGSVGPVDSHDSGFVDDSVDPYHYYRRQVSATVYEELRVYFLELRYVVVGDNSIAGQKADTTLLIPVDFAVSRTYPMQVQEELYARGLRIICNSAVTVKIRWYERGLFADLLKLAGVLLIIFDGGLTASLAAAASVGAGAVIELIVLTILANLVVTYAFQLFVKLVGGDAALVLAVVASAFAGVQLLDKTIKIASLTAAQLLTLASGLIKASAMEVQKDLLNLSAEFEAFKDEAAEQTKLLDQAKALLNDEHRMNPLVIYGETPTNYFNRTVHSGNVGTIGYAAIQSYVDMALTLPTLADTIVENGDGGT